MTLDDQTSAPDVEQSGDTSVADSQGSSDPGSKEAEAQEAAPTQTAENIPFNDPRSPMHARFKELHEQATSFKTELERERSERAQMRAEYEQRLEQIKNQFQPRVEQPKPFQPLLERLKGIDPEFAQFQEKSLQAMEQLPQLSQELQAIRQERDRILVNQKLGSLYDQYKVPEDRRKMYESSIKAISYENPKLSLKDADTVFKNVHDELSKHYDALERKIREGYVKAKKADATPASTTGGQPASNKPKAKEMSREDYRAYVRSEFVKELRKGKL